MANNLLNKYVWLVETIYKAKRISFEEIPDGEQYLPAIIEALKKNKVLEMTYHGFSRDKAYSFKVEPYCLKAFKQRWYLIGRSPYNDQIKIYALDRVRWLWMTDKGFKYPEDLVPGEFFEESYGIIADRKIDAETVVMRVSTKQANYLRSLPLHHTQKEIERTDEYSIFSVHLRPTFDFRQEILSQGVDIEVLSPKWFRDEIAEISKQMYNKYQ